MFDNLRQRRGFAVATLALTGIVVFALIWCLGIKTPAYSVYINGQPRFAAKDAGQVRELAQKIQQREEKRCKQPLELSGKVDFKRVFISRNQLVPGAEMEARLQKELQFKTQAVAILVNGKVVACVKDKAVANQLLGKLKKENARVGEDEKLIRVAFEEKVTVEEKKVAVKDVLNVDQALELITTGSKNPEKYIVKEGDSLWLIARRNDMYVDDIMQANRLKTDKLDLDQELILVKSKPFINVVAQVEGEKTELIPFETKVVEDKNSPSSIRIKQLGQNGERHVVYVASVRNGVVEDRQIKEETILKQAVDKIIVKGSRVTRVASRSGGGGGNLDWPAYGPITQYFSGGHRAIDIGARSGSTIVAADDGIVTFCGSQGGYGRMIIIKHSNGISTRYAHCSSINVSSGQSVMRGQAIGTVGSTGRSTGPHLHFEVMAGGAQLNPLNYLR